MNNSHPLIDLLTTYQTSHYDRLSWDDYFISQSLLISFRSPSQKLQVGAVITINNRVVSTGYNGYFSGLPHESIHVDGHEVNTIHAEQNAIADAAKRGVSINGGVLYITHYPCINCAKMIIASGIQQIKYLNDYKNDPICRDLMFQAKIKIDKLNSHQSGSLNPPLYLCSVPLLTYNGNNPISFIVLTEKQIGLLKFDFQTAPLAYEKNKGCCQTQSPCFACLVGGFKYEIDKLKIINEIGFEAICSTSEIISNQPFINELKTRLETIELSVQSPLSAQIDNTRTQQEKSSDTWYDSD